MKHPLEIKLNVGASDIMDAIAAGFRAEADVKGKLAELGLKKVLDSLLSQNIVTGFEWHDADGVPDFTVQYRSATVRIECKNVRSGHKLSGDGWATVELQKTRGGKKDGKPTRGYALDHFDILAACLFNSSGKWEYRFIPTANLQPRDEDPTTLKVMQKVLVSGKGRWSDRLPDVLETILRLRAATSGRLRKNPG